MIVFVCFITFESQKTLQPPHASKRPAHDHFLSNHPTIPRESPESPPPTRPVHSSYDPPRIPRTWPLADVLSFLGTGQLVPSEHYIHNPATQQGDVDRGLSDYPATIPTRSPRPPPPRVPREGSGPERGLSNHPSFYPNPTPGPERGLSNHPQFLPQPYPNPPDPAPRWLPMSSPPPPPKYSAVLEEVRPVLEEVRPIVLFP